MKFILLIYLFVLTHNFFVFSICVKYETIFLNLI